MQEQSVTALVDSGAETNLLGKDTLTKLGMDYQCLQEPITLKYISNTKKEVIGNVLMSSVYRNGLYNMEW